MHECTSYPRTWRKQAAAAASKQGSLVCDRQPACLALARRVVSSSFFSCKGASRVCDSMACWFLSASIHISCCEDRQASYLMPTKLVQLALFVRLRVGSSLAIVFADSLGESLACVPSWEEDGRTAAFRTSRVAWIVPEIAVLLACGPSKWQCSRWVSTVIMWFCLALWRLVWVSAFGLVGSLGASFRVSSLGFFSSRIMPCGKLEGIILGTLFGRHWP